jgi:hypothetical protein
MRRALLFCVGTVLAGASVIILWNGAELYLFTDGWHSAALTHVVGVAVIVEGIVVGLAAAVSLGRALRPLTAAGGGGPVLPILGLLLLLAAAGPFGQARDDSERLEVMDAMPGQWGPDLVTEFRVQQRTEWTFGVFWLAAGGALLGTPLFLAPRTWRLGWPMNGAGCGIAAAGLVLCCLGSFVCFVNGLTMEGASSELAFAGYLGVLAGAVVAVVGSVVAVRGAGGG